MANLKDLAIQLFDIQAVKFGTFTLKSGISSPVYFDLRVIVSYPKIMRSVSEFMWKAVKDAECEYASICGVPYTALPIATCMSADHDIPMLIRRKEAKGYGTKKIIEGHFSAGDKCLIAEDVVTSGSSVLETVKSLQDEGLVVTDAVVLLDREQGGSKRLAQNNIRLHSICSISKLMLILLEAGKVDQKMVNQVQKFITENNTFNPEAKPAEEVKKVLTYVERAAQCTHPLSKRLFSIMQEKRTNLALSADVNTAAELIQMADSIGPYICVLKTHIDIIEDFSADLIQKLSSLAAKHNFIIFEDRKFADIGNTVKQQYGGGMYRISEWADIINAHAVPGPGIIQGLKEVGATKNRACLMLAQMSSKGTLAKDTYTAESVKMAEGNKDFVIGFICTEKLSSDPAMLHMTPGVQLSAGVDGLGQQYLTPQEVITNRESDVIIVGRGITQSANPMQAAKEYQEAGFLAYQALFN
ncbi:hypothetical protein CAPTEDRAFT_222872 [Capitella teleta]|uniref:Uridine 5'-monophosphate synthase n=1 Tax=Capitella teleta TaxID=283909 RepID=R7U604_CAPTE|nr:hypothetical protein CAPTEDRAFT_222872 [Capitella teleta]|eukprot:ELU01511.1 hypothetical protein CAPTEDRAFT_222872 [Capitella teleta]